MFTSTSSSDFIRDFGKSIELQPACLFIYTINLYSFTYLKKYLLHTF